MRLNGLFKKEFLVSFIFLLFLLFPNFGSAASDSETTTERADDDFGGGDFGGLTLSNDLVAPAVAPPSLNIFDTSDKKDRLVVRKEDGSAFCEPCGGFTEEVEGACCFFCGRLSYKACWCRTCECLCYNN